MTGLVRTLFFFFFSFWLNQTEMLWPTYNYFFIHFWYNEKKKKIICSWMIFLYMKQSVLILKILKINSIPKYHFEITKSKYSICMMLKWKLHYLIKNSIILGQSNLINGTKIPQMWFKTTFYKFKKWKKIKVLRCFGKHYFGLPLSADQNCHGILFNKNCHVYANYTYIL